MEVVVVGSERRVLAPGGSRAHGRSAPLSAAAASGGPPSRRTPGAAARSRGRSASTGTGGSRSAENVPARTAAAMARRPSSIEIGRSPSSAVRSSSSRSSKNWPLRLIVGEVLEDHARCPSARCRASGSVMPRDDRVPQLREHVVDRASRPRSGRGPAARRRLPGRCRRARPSPRATAAGAARRRSARCRRRRRPSRCGGCASHRAHGSSRATSSRPAPGSSEPRSSSISFPDSAAYSSSRSGRCVKGSCDRAQRQPRDVVHRVAEVRQLPVDDHDHRDRRRYMKLPGPVSPCTSTTGPS